jgi:3-deoxy-7-phosphoheptulonate synthase
MSSAFPRRPWFPQSYLQFPAQQQPVWPDPTAYDEALATLRKQPPLVFAGEVRQLKQLLAEVGQGKAFLLQGGDCAEEFDRSGAKDIREKLKILLQMAVVLTFGLKKPVVKLGRIAGQFAKPRSKDTETIDGVTMSAYRGDAVNQSKPTPEARTPDPQRMIRAYFQSAATLNLLRAFTHGGFADLRRVHSWNVDFLDGSPLGEEYRMIAREITSALDFMESCGLSSAQLAQLHQVDLFTSHEALLLGYEEALTRTDSITGQWYNCSAHLLWIGDRTRQLEGAHLEFLRGVENPIGIKLGPGFSPVELPRLIENLNPKNEEGKILLITRFGAEGISEHLPPLLDLVNSQEYQVVWSCDPMHGNTYLTPNGFKTRHFNDILKELTEFFRLHEAFGTIPGGIHFELTGEWVTECLGGADNIETTELSRSYETACDPRLNARQSLEIAFIITKMLKENLKS